jgi:hypothetical protein
MSQVSKTEWRAVIKLLTKDALEPNKRTHGYCNGEGSKNHLQR